MLEMALFYFTEIFSYLIVGDLNAHMEQLTFRLYIRVVAAGNLVGKLGTNLVLVTEGNSTV
jgi:hypothetical protein